MRLLLQERFRIERHGRKRVVDIVGNAARHLPQGAQPLLLQHGLLGLAQVVVRLLQGGIELRLMRGQRDLFA